MWAATYVSATTVKPNVWSGNTLGFTDTVIVMICPAQHPLHVSPSEETDPSSAASIISCLNLFLGGFSSIKSTQTEDVVRVQIVKPEQALCFYDSGLFQIKLTCV